MAEKATKTKRTSKSADIEKLVVELGKKNVPPEKIGLILRDQHGISKAKLHGKKISTILKENGIPFLKELDNVEVKQAKLKKHFAKHKHDYTARRMIFKYTGKIHKLKKQAAK